MRHPGLVPRGAGRGRAGIEPGSANATHSVERVSTGTFRSVMDAVTE